MRRYSLARTDGRIWIDGSIHPDRVSAAAVRRSFTEISGDGPVRLVLDTLGGSCAEGLAIYTVLRECGRPVEVTVRRAFSMGAVLLAAAQTVAIEATGAIGLHPAGVSHNDVDSLDAAAPHHVTADRLRQLARGLSGAEATRADAVRVLSMARIAEGFDATHLDILARRTGLPRHELTALCAAETVLTAERAVALRFADRIIPNQET